MTNVTIGGSEALRIAWAAGVFEGEGSFYGNGRRIRASVVMTDEDVVRKFHAWVNCGTVYSREDKRPASDGTPRKPCWKWEASSDEDFKSIVTRFMPYLGERRMRRARELLAERAAYIASKTAERPCAVCGQPLRSAWPGGRDRVYCDAKCKATAYRRRRACQTFA